MGQKDAIHTVTPHVHMYMYVHCGIVCSVVYGAVRCMNEQWQCSVVLVCDDVM